MNFKVFLLRLLITSNIENKYKYDLEDFKRGILLLEDFCIIMA